VADEQQPTLDAKAKSEPGVGLVLASELPVVEGKLFHEVTELVKAINQGKIGDPEEGLPPGTYYAIRIIKPIVIRPPKPVTRNVVQVGPSLQAKPNARGKRKTQAAAGEGN
jgi:hypothetical protein